MKITVVNGSARKGNTWTAIQSFLEGVKGEHEVDIIQADALNLVPCKGCDVCKCQNGCISKDDTNATVDRIVESDFILFATPVYWWGMSAQTKLVIDKCYSKGLKLRGKNVGVLIIGAAGLEDLQYELIEKQFQCMANYLSWDLKFVKSYSAAGKEDLKQQTEAVEQLKAIGASIA